MLIVNCIPDELGWSPIQHLVSLAARLLDAEVAIAPPTLPSYMSKLASVIKGRSPRAAGRENCLLICAGPGDLARLLSVHGWRRRFNFLGAWVIDSFWLDYLPSSTLISKPFDHFFITSQEDLADWNRITGVPTSWLPWGTDALGLGGAAAERTWDLTRVGRQPPEWEDDAATAAAAAARGLKFRGRPNLEKLTPLENQRQMMRAYADSKYILAFSNGANPEKYTHPTRQYLTGRWVDSLACGSTVAGVAPHCPDAEQLLWPGATLELGGIRRDDGLERIAGAVENWSAESAAYNHRMALTKLDWRWRLKIIADMIGIAAPALRDDIGVLSQRIDAHRSVA